MFSCFVYFFILISVEAARLDTVPLYFDEFSNSPLNAYLDPPEPSESCFVVEKRNFESKPCVFPFKYKGRVYNGCITRNDPDEKLWCSTAVDSEGFHTLGREFWGHCSSDCPNDKSGVEIEKIKALPPRGPKLDPHKVSTLTDAALDVVGGDFKPPFARLDVSESSPTKIDLEIPDGIEWFNSAKTRGTWSFHCTFAGNENDLKRLRLKAGLCMQTCSQTQGCTHFSWTSQSGGSCFLKTNPVKPDNAIYDENSICGFFVQTETKTTTTTDQTVSNIEYQISNVELQTSNIDLQKSNIEWLPDNSAVGCDFSSPTFHSQPTVRDNCRLMCNKFVDCSHFTWKGQPGLRLGDCNLKQGPVNKSSAFRTFTSHSVCGLRIEREDLESVFPRGLIMKDLPKS